MKNMASQFSFEWTVF